MDKSYHEMTEAERIANRIAKNRRIELRLLSKPGRLSLDGILDQLDLARQRATYGAVSELVRIPARGLMTGRPKTPKHSWVVAATTGQDARRGWPTGYTRNQIHPDCYRQACAGEDNIIESAADLRAWLKRRSTGDITP